LSSLHGGFQVRQYRPWKVWVGCLLLLVFLAVSFHLGRSYQSYELDRALLERETLITRIDELESRNHKLVQENA